jgi:hypothetical protein
MWEQNCRFGWVCLDYVTISTSYNWNGRIKQKNKTKKHLPEVKLCTPEIYFLPIAWFPFPHLWLLLSSWSLGFVLKGKGRKQFTFLSAEIFIGCWVRVSWVSLIICLGLLSWWQISQRRFLNWSYSCYWRALSI